MSTQNVKFARFARNVVKWHFFSDFRTKCIILYFRMNQRGMNQTFIEPTEMRLDPRYTTYYLSWTRAFLLALFPFVLLLILNGKIIRQLKKSENISSSARVINFIMDINCIICTIIKRNLVIQSWNYRTIWIFAPKVYNMYRCVWPYF